jgi:hypothetical protein
MRTLAVKNWAMFALYKRTFPRAAGVSPPWVGFTLASAIGFCGLITFRPAHSRPGTTAGSRQPLLVARRPFAVKNDIRAVQTHVSKSGVRQPAVVCDSRERCAVKIGQCSATGEDTSKSGGCQPAVGLRACTRFTPNQERRASARRPSARDIPLYKRTFPRAAGVSPPWFGIALARRSVFAD